MEGQIGCGPISKANPDGGYFHRSRDAIKRDCTNIGSYDGSIWKTRLGNSRGIMIERGDRMIKQGGSILERTFNVNLIDPTFKKKNNYHNRI